MKSTVSFHPVDVAFFDDVIGALCEGGKINPEAFLRDALRIRHVWWQARRFARGLELLATRAAAVEAAAERVDAARKEQPSDFFIGAGYAYRGEFDHLGTLESSFTWHFYSSDDQFELNWTEQTISSATYKSVDNRLEIRLTSPVSASRVKVTTPPLHLLAPGEIRYQRIRAFTALRSQEPENLDQQYSFGINWAKGTRTTLGYEGSYRSRSRNEVIRQGPHGQTACITAIS